VPSLNVLDPGADADPAVEASARCIFLAGLGAGTQGGRRDLDWDW